jgi:hypothetical protein
MLTSGGDMMETHLQAELDGQYLDQFVAALVDILLNGKDQPPCEPQGEGKGGSEGSAPGSRSGASNTPGLLGDSATLRPTPLE